jgi:hypothetical protein
LADDHTQRAAVRANQIPLGQVGAAELAENRRDNIGVAEIDSGGR